MTDTSNYPDIPTIQVGKLTFEYVGPCTPTRLHQAHYWECRRGPICFFLYGVRTAEDAPVEWACDARNNPAAGETAVPLLLADYTQSGDSPEAAWRILGAAVQRSLTFARTVEVTTTANIIPEEP